MIEFDTEMPFRFITLMNPPKRKTSMRIMHRRRRTSARRARRPAVNYMNPPRRRKVRRSRPATARKSRHHSPAMRAKISRAVKAAMRRRRSGGGVVRSKSRRRAGGFAMARRPARRSMGGGLYVIKGRKLNPPRSRRFGRRLFRRRNPSGLASITGLLSKDVMAMAAGAITGSVATGFVMNRFGTSLPFASNKYGMMVYQLAIPLTGAYLLRKRYRNFAAGLAVGGVIMAITTVMKSGLLGAGATNIIQGPMGNFYEVAGMGLAGEIGRRQNVRTMGTYITPKTYNTVPNAVNAPVFAQGAW